MKGDLRVHKKKSGSRLEDTGLRSVGRQTQQLLVEERVSI